MVKGSTFVAGQVVWVRLDERSWWPALVVPPAETPSSFPLLPGSRLVILLPLCAKQ